MTHDDTLKRAAELLRHMSDAGSTDEYRSCNDCATAIDALREELARQEPPTTGYVQTVPDKCDRIVWRGSYFHLPIAPQAAQAPEGWQLVPKEPTEPQWGGLARDIVMWLEMHPGPEKTPRALFLHLERLGRQIPDWLRNEPEMQALDHVPSKGTRATVIYKAMLAAAPQQKEKS